ncbi:hypothetical protein LTR08_001311 [Meristemomyces frigidus]|nr:hypothetical protein LTR08_001311 [Meristemomyces frigidus]
MAHQESAAVTTKGKADGKPVTFTYHRHANANDSELSWEQDAAPVRRLAAQDIVAVLHKRVQEADDLTVLYVENTVPDDKKEQVPGALETLVATKLPQPFSHDFLLPRDAYWQTHQAHAPGHPALHILVSVKSGTGKALDVWEHMLCPMLYELEASDYMLHLTTSENSVTDLTRDTFLPQANLGVAQTVILLSGDGGMADLVNAILSEKRSKSYKKPTIVLLPLGTGNALANSAGIAADNTMGLRTLLHGSPKELPLFRATFSPGARLLVNELRDERPLQKLNGTPVIHGAVVCSWGLHASLVADSDSSKYRKFGAERFPMAAKDLLYPADGAMPHPYKGRVSVLRPSTEGKGDDWEPIDRETHGYVLATLVSQLEKGFTISPMSRPLDGKLRLVHFGPLSGKGAMDVMTKAYDGGKHATDERVGYEEVEGVKIHFEEEEARWRRVCVDGKIVQVEAGGWVALKSGIEGVVDLVVGP